MKTSLGVRASLFSEERSSDPRPPGAAGGGGWDVGQRGSRTGAAGSGVGALGLAVAGGAGVRGGAFVAGGLGLRMAVRIAEVGDSAVPLLLSRGYVSRQGNAGSECDRRLHRQRGRVHANGSRLCKYGSPAFARSAVACTSDPRASVPLEDRTCDPGSVSSHQGGVGIPREWWDLPLTSLK